MLVPFDSFGSAITPEISIDRVVDLLTGPNSAELRARHGATIEQLCRASAKGFAIRDLDKLNKVLIVTSKAVSIGETALEIPLCMLLR